MTVAGGMNVVNTSFFVNTAFGAPKSEFTAAKTAHEYKLKATVELVGAPEVNPVNLLLEQGTALELPVQVHLENPGSFDLLGANCYIGSSTTPITLDLTTGTSGSLTGAKRAGLCQWVVHATRDRETR